jgi:hypothetical protein
MGSAWSERDQFQLESRGISVDAADRQMELLRQPSHFPRLERPCVIGDGIQQISEDRHAALIDVHRQAACQGRWTKFVPASGAASRMFAWKGEDDLTRLTDQLDHFAFYRSLESAASRSGYVLSELRTRRQHSILLDLLLGDAGLGYNDLPKALLEFHRYGETARTPFEEHLREGARSLAGGGERCRAHFTVSPEHQPRFEELLSRLIPVIRGELAVNPDVGFSQQKPSTDLLALDEDSLPLRDDDGSLVFRPGGHGALLDNLNDLDGDLVFVKNIDNVCHARWQSASEHWIQVLGGSLIQLQSEIQRCLTTLETAPAPQACLEAERWVRGVFPGLVDALPETSDPPLRARKMRQLLHRPVRVCGVVRNQGEPGGGPFWVRETDHSHSLQIVESVEVDPQDQSQQRIFSAATHFNPVFMALGLRDRHGQPFPLQDYVSDERFLLTWKSVQGRQVRVLERPGLWNGSMAAWNTVFVEVPKEVFTPVKTVFDLLRDEHQP